MIVDTQFTRSSIKFNGSKNIRIYKTHRSVLLIVKHMKKLRSYKKSDEAAVLNIYASSKMDELVNEKERFEFISLTQDTERYIKLFESKIFVYDDNGVIGYCAYFENEIRALFVQSSFRGRGIGQQMLKFMLSAIGENPILFVAKSNTQAKEIYRKHGFKVVDEFETKYNGKVVMANRMEKSIETR